MAYDNLFEKVLYSLFEDDVFKNLNTASDILTKEIEKLNEFKNKKNNDNGTAKKRREYSFEYKEALDPEEKKKIVIAKLNKYTDLMKLDENNDYEMHISFKFGEDEFYFDWDNDLQMFVTTDPNGDKFAYDANDEQLARITEAKDDEESNEGDVSKNDDDKEDEIDDCDDCEDHPFNFDLKDDKNLAFNLKNALKKYHDENADCKAIFCPYSAADMFKNLIIDSESYDAMFDDYGNPTQIVFSIEHFVNTNSLADIYHNESQNLDKFCELIKDKYNFSLGSWNVYFSDEERKDVKNIDFIFTF